MKRLAWIMLLACSTAASGQSAGDSGDKQKILALEHAWDQALSGSDIKALSAIFDSSLIYIDDDGALLTKSAYLSRLRQTGGHVQQIVTEEMDVQVFGATAVVVGTYRERGVQRGKSYTRRGRFMDTWVLTGKNWICVASSATPILH
ncbi:MAG TPA: nuclear transport factor 2 family protein [Candidatus Sulfotelmatobacter sp.]|jgi:ketosteroid isomerase-like protein